MPDYFSHGVLGKIVPAKRVKPKLEGYSLETELGKQSNPTLTGILSQLMIGDKVTSYNPYMGVATFGKLATIVSIDTKPKYSILQSGMLSTKYAHKEEEIHFAYYGSSLDNKKVFTAISTIGLGYTPQQPSKDDKEIRRWPRNWYGDNIKS